MRNKLYILLLLFIACATGFAKVVYMSPNGSDGADGNIGHPFATLPAAYKAIEGGDRGVLERCRTDEVYCGT